MVPNKLDEIVDDIVNRFIPVLVPIKEIKQKLRLQCDWFCTASQKLALIWSTEYDFIPAQLNVSLNEFLHGELVIEMSLLNAENFKGSFEKINL